MNESSKLCVNTLHTDQKSSTNLVKITEDMLLYTRSLREKDNNIVFPQAELTMLGSAFSSMLPAFRSVTMNLEGPKGLYRVANMVPGGELHQTKAGAIYGSIRKEGMSPMMAKWQEVDSSFKSVTTLPIDPATIMMAVALMSIEQKLSEISDLQRDILKFLEIEKEAEIEADIETLIDIVSKFKYNWDNNQFLSSNHKMVLDIQRTSRKHMISFSKKISNLLEVNKK